MADFYYNCSINNEASKLSPFEVSYVFQPAITAVRFQSLAGAPAPTTDCLPKLANVRDVVRELLALPKQRIHSFPKVQSLERSTSVLAHFKSLKRLV